ncbi:MAG TPA: adenosylmethionine--8-amino-7-oxononanoate transaminase [Tepidisphaeraceae bacterium]|jgi:adenosylmethionine-8-amino-7-oxononanoate aminotransferase
MNTESLRQLDRRYIWHPFTHMRQWLESEQLVITDAEGMYLIDSDGKRYLDGVSSLWCNVHGHRVAEIDAAIVAQLNRVAHTTMLGLASEPGLLLAEKLMPLVPAGLEKIFFSDAGATATEIAFKLAVQYWHNLGRGEKNEIVAFAEAYHGDTVGAMSVGRVDAFHRPYFPMMFPVHFAPSPIAGNSLDELEKILREKSGRIAAVCIEPIVQGAGGIIVHPGGFLARVRKLCDAHEVLLIADEVAVGFGRTGRMFACEHENVSPDLMCLGKGISGGYLPLAATLSTRQIFDAFLGEPWEGKTFFHGHTYTGNPLACAAAVASLELFEKNKLVNSVAAKSEKLAEMLNALRPLKYVGDIRQKGFMVGIQLVRDKGLKEHFDPKRRIGAEVCQRIRRHGIILRPLGDVIVLMPPLAMGVEDLRKIVAAVATEIEQIA